MGEGRLYEEEIMNARERIVAAQDRLVRLFEKRPSAAKGTGVTKAVLRDGLVCEASGGPWRMTFDQPENYGGTDSAPDPGFAGRAAVGACLVQGYAIAFAKAGIALEHLEVEVCGESDGRGNMALADVPAGYQRLTCKVSLKADAPRETVEELLSSVEAHSPWFYNMAAALPVERELTLL